jgi:hypothetical protein
MSLLQQYELAHYLGQIKITLAAKIFVFSFFKKLTRLLESVVHTSWLPNKHVTRVNAEIHNSYLHTNDEIAAQH